MDNKLFVSIIAVVLVVAGVSVAAFTYDGNQDNTDNPNAFNVIARANSEGSGLYIKSSLVDPSSTDIPLRKVGNELIPFFNKDWSVNSNNAKAWGGLIFGTPGTSSIQHTQLADLASKMGLKFTLYSTSIPVSSDTLYYDSGITNYGQAVTNTVIQGGILWEPQYQLIISDTEGGFRSLALTNDVFPEHTCCIVAGNGAYMKANQSATERFLAGYVKAVDSVNKILSEKNTNPTAYNEFVEFVMDKVPSLSGQADVTEKALDNITYLYADDSQGNLGHLESDIASLIRNLSGLGVFTKQVKNPEMFAEEFVTHSYLKNAMANEYDNSVKTNIKVAVITGDIHQIAIHWGVEEGLFADVGIGVEIVGSSNGAGVATALVNGEATFGFLGAPPATITTVNSGYIEA